MQHYGFMRIYDAKRGEISAVTARMDWAISFFWYLTLSLATDSGLIEEIHENDLSVPRD